MVGGSRRNRGCSRLWIEIIIRSQVQTVKSLCPPTVVLRWAVEPFAFLMPSKTRLTSTCFTRETPTIILTLDNFRQLNKNIISIYDGFVQDAPFDWTKDGFYKNHVPTSITSRFGQDQRICQEGTMEAEAQKWDEERDYAHIRYISFALATDIR